MIRTIIKVGNSEGITIPVGELRAHKLKIGDKVEVYIGKPGERAKDLEFLRAAEKFLAEYQTALKKSSKK